MERKKEERRERENGKTGDLRDSWKSKKDELAWKGEKIISFKTFVLFLLLPLHIHFSSSFLLFRFLFPLSHHIFENLVFPFTLSFHPSLFFFWKKKKSHLSSAYVLRYSNYFENTASPFQEACDASCKELMIFTCSRGGHCSTKLLFFKRLVMHIAKS